MTINFIGCLLLWFISPFKLLYKLHTSWFARYDVTWKSTGVNEPLHHRVRRLMTASFSETGQRDRPFLSSREPTPYAAFARKKSASIFRTLKDSLGTRRTTCAKRQNRRVRTWKCRERTFSTRSTLERGQSMSSPRLEDRRKETLFFPTYTQKRTRPSSSY